MARKKDTTPPIRPEEIIQKTMEDVMHDSMMPYSEYVILERALPRVEDGLKPVQRRILFTMHELGNTPDKPHRKCARIVGDCLGKYHPHGDTSVYDALARMAQPFVMRTQLVDGHGNFGSIDGDSPAAMRYTEARMTEQALVLLQDIEKDTVGFHLNFDDSLKEPDVLPGRFPNLLVNGASGIAVGLATNIPPHNMGEAIDGTIALIDHPDCTTVDLMRYIQAPDFPTGGIVAADEELLQAYETGRGKLQVRAKVHVEDAPNGKKLIVLDEMPYQVNKAALLERILRLSEEKKNLLSGINDIRDESDRTGMRAVVELKRGTDPDQVLNVLYKYTDLQISFGVNMVAIADGKPLQMGLKQMLEYYVAHQKNVVSRRTKYDLDQAEARAHILEGLIIAVDHLDEVIRLIRSSKTPKEARERLMERFSLTAIQAQAILDMRLQRLTNLEILALRQEYEALQKRIHELQGILKSEKKLMNVIKKELLEIRNRYADARRTQIVPSFEAITIQEEKPIAEDAVVLLTRNGFVKRMTPKSYERTATGDSAELPLVVLSALTDQRLLFLTNAGYCYAVSVDQIPECRPKDRGLAVGGLLAGLEKTETVISMLNVGDWSGCVALATKQGIIKRVALSDLNVRKSRYACMKLREGDALIAAMRVDENQSVLLITQKGLALNLSQEDIPQLGRTAAGVHGIALKPNDELLRVFAHNGEGEVILCTELGYMKRCLLVDFDRQSRGKTGSKCFAFAKGGLNGNVLADAILVREPYAFRIVQKSGTTTRMESEEVEIENKSGKGNPYILVVMDDIVVELQPEKG
ncbi:MAG: DNA gyrase subunit A [Clostridia bacterium]|nr:DNA gyrase subunit A [Clostridia bacterium]